MIPLLTAGEALEVIEMLDTDQLFDLLDYARNCTSPETFRVKMCEWLRARRTAALLNAMEQSWEQKCRLRAMRRKVLLG